MITHKLKIYPNYLENLISGKKRAEIRYNDRDYQVGDHIEFWREDVGVILFRITHIHTGLGVQPDYCVLSLERA